MLTISSNQFEKFRRAALDRYAMDLAACLAAEGHPSWAQRKDLRGIVHRSVLWAYEYGLREDREYRAFAELALHLGEHFHAYPAIHEILMSEEEDRFAALQEGVHPQQWRDAEVFSRAIDHQGEEASLGS